MGSMAARWAISMLVGKAAAAAAGGSGVGGPWAWAGRARFPRAAPGVVCLAVTIAPVLWLKAFHVVFVVTWFAGLFYLPRLFVYHVAASEREGLARFVVMERRLFFIMTLGALLAVLCGAAMIVGAPGYLTLGGMRAKLLLVAALIGYHGRWYHLMRVLRAGGHRHAQLWYRLFNELPPLLLVAIVVLAGVQPRGTHPVSRVHLQSAPSCR